MTTITGVTAADVQAITGVTVDDSVIAQARSVIELYASVDLSNFAAFDARNRFYLQKAIAYQAAWIPTQPGLFTKTDFQSLSQDGLSITTRDANSMLIAPYALMALKRVSWNRARTVRVAPGRQTRLAQRLNYPNGTDSGYIAPVPGTPYSDADFDGTNSDWL